MSDDSPKNRLTVIVDDDGETVVLDDRGGAILCKNCRFSGWLRYTDFSQAIDARFRRDGVLPSHCLHYSGGANPVDGQRIVFPDHRNYSDHLDASWHRAYPTCASKNQHGNCKDYLAVTRAPWWSPRRWWFTNHLRMRS